MESITCKVLQRHTLLPCSQHEHLYHLSVGISSKIGVVGPMTDAERSALTADGIMSEKGKISVVPSSVRAFIEDMG